MRRNHELLLHYLYPRHEDIYLRDLRETSTRMARATFVFGHNPRTSDFTHVGAAEMLGGVSQAAYCMALNHTPELLRDDTISRCCFSALNVTFSKMLAPKTEATLTLEMETTPSGLPRLNFEGFINGSVDCGLSDADLDHHQPKMHANLPASVRRTLHSFYNNGSELTLKALSHLSPQRWVSHSEFSPDPRLRFCRYTTTTQIIVGLSQLAFAVVGEANVTTHRATSWETGEFRDSMSDQALVKLSYSRPAKSALDLRLDSTLAASRKLKGCRFVRLQLEGDLSGTMDCMLSPRVPVKSLKQTAQP